MHAQGNGIPGNVHSLSARSATRRGQAQVPLTVPWSQAPSHTGNTHPTSAIKLQIKRTSTVDVLCLLSALSDCLKVFPNVVFNYFNERENYLRSVSSMGQGPDGNARSGIISSAVNSTLSEVIGAKCKQLLELTDVRSEAGETN